MRLDRLKSLPSKGVSMDTETWALEHGVPVPRLVLGSAGWLEPGPRVVGALLDRDAVLDLFASVVEDPDAVLVGANIAQFDLLVIAVYFAELGIDVLPAIFALLESGRLYCIQISEALNAIATGTLGVDPRTGGALKNPDTGKPGSYSQAMVCDLVLGRQGTKSNDEFRLRYGEFDGVPLADLPPAARDYPVDDVVNCHDACLAQTGHLPKTSSQHEWGVVDGASVCVSCGSTRFSAQCLVRRPHLNLHEVSNQVYSAFCLHLGDAWGLRVDQSKVDVIEAHAIRKRAATITPFVEAGMIRADGSENRAVIKRLIAVAYGSTEPCPHCAGTGEVPSEKQDTLRCPDCRGRCQPFKSGGKIKPPEVASCATCRSTARVPHPTVKMTTCVAADGSKTCDGSGLLLHEDVPRAEKEGISFGKDACNESADEFLMSFGAFNDDAKVLKDYVPYLRTARLCTGCGRSGVKKFPHLEGCAKPGWRDITLKLSSNAVLETGRVSYRGYIQLFPRAPGFVDRETGEYIPSLRECFVARGPTYEYVDVPDDYVLAPGELLC